MTARIDAAVLWVRAVVLGVVTLFLGVAGHVTADGLLPGPPFLVALLVGSVLLSAPVLARQVSPLRMVALLVGGQTAIHLVLSVAAGHAGDRVAAVATPRGTPLGTLPTVDGRRVGSLQDAYDGMSSQGGLAPTLPIGHLVGDLAAHAPMMAAHLAAAALVGLWLGYGERCLFTLIALSGRRVLAAAWALAPVVVPPRVAPVDAARALAGPRSVWLVRPDSRRGPPLLLV
ncbi:hypothetical protein GON03_15915 [Nocardioides sp. MAH-18]|uniref:Uncharacterized protein n=1 Tax=Nocardioides agri TaxID=2682843 RepID=A0A6L6XU05_9ACTN|nr:MULTISPECIES: hypothetical protein [unclassified Nocardioides]MBA2955821.1 hypothetical protein [Nocardioides sp. CGMCC 1.13656]MVQ50670.1 hypothetical protein [Nocardioides sp. MAH-18]